MKQIVCLCMFVWLGAHEIDDALAQECIKRYYPQVERIADNEVVLESGARFIWDDGKEKDYDEKILSPDMNDAFSYPYPLQGNVLDRNKDTSRVRHLGFYKEIYGHSADEVKTHLVKLPWFPHRFEKGFVVVTTLNGVSEAFARVMQRLKGYTPSILSVFERPRCFLLA